MFGRKKGRQDVRIPIKKQTRDNLEALNRSIGALTQQVETSQQALAIAEQRFLDSVRPLLTEAGLGDATPIMITDKKPYALIVEVTK